MAHHGVVLKSEEDLDKAKVFVVRLANLLSYLSASTSPPHPPRMAVVGGPEGGVAVVEGVAFEYRVAEEEGGLLSITLECSGCGRPVELEVRVPKEWLLS